VTKPQYQEASDSDYAPASKPGEQLRKARESKGFSVEDVVAQIRLERKLLEAVENDDYAKLPAPGYVRGYIRTYARFLGLDPAPLVEAFNREADEGPALQPYSSTPAQQAHSGDSLVKAVTWGIGVGLVLLVVVWWRSQYLHKPAPESLASGPTTSEAAAPPPPNIVKQGGLPYTYPIVKHPDELTPSASAATASAAAVEPAASSAAPSSAASIAPPSTATGITPAAKATTVAGAATGTTAPTHASQQEHEAAAQPASASATGTAGHRLVLKLSKESWIEIADSTGKRLYYNLGRAGQTIDVSGKPPLHVLIGYVPGVDISYDGKSLDVSALARHGVARFQIRKDGSVE